MGQALSGNQHGITVNNILTVSEGKPDAAPSLDV